MMIRAPSVPQVVQPAVQAGVRRLRDHDDDAAGAQDLAGSTSRQPTPACRGRRGRRLSRLRLRTLSEEDVPVHVPVLPSAAVSPANLSQHSAPPPTQNGGDTITPPSIIRSPYNQNSLKSLPNEDSSSQSSYLSRSSQSFYDRVSSPQHAARAVDSNATNQQVTNIPITIDIVAASKSNRGSFKGDSRFCYEAISSEWNSNKIVALATLGPIAFRRRPIGFAFDERETRSKDAPRDEMA
ncbi:hypothetical protein EVAR_10438_1 [Eumeta japonica]|uniref:Uncharacterized protein n=1 Tax=Eumeta variegata TaxID=151549 RepID=A0A4C1THA5_EUMVA|nr:hypothetical protein EVAR_10438_1 [Eumeta japonica]